MSENNLILLNEKELTQIIKIKRNEFEYRTISKVDFPKYQREKWNIKKETSSTYKMEREKTLFQKSMDKVWVDFARLGFDGVTVYGKSFLDDEYSFICLNEEIALVTVVRCNPEKERERISFDKDISYIKDNKQKVIGNIRKLSEKKVKVGFLFVTIGYIVNDSDIYKMSDNQITYLTEEALEYYDQLFKHIGKAALYQLLGSVFRGQKIEELDTSVAAIEGKMGDHIYYSFSIEPKKLLKIGYVLHRNNANKDLMPTYQRIIKKDRISQIRKFVSGGGFFPNSLVVNIDVGTRKLIFEKSEKQVEGNTTLGILKLPQIYRSAYIIDGQHRLYGYSETEFESKDTIPVIAFTNLGQTEQIKLFMEINENQKSVSKNLRNTLNADLLWNSTSARKRNEALKLNIAQKLGENFDSPLFGRVLIGENAKTSKCNITIEFIKSALDDSRIVNSYDRKESIINEGLLDTEKNDITSVIVYNFIRDCFIHLEEQSNAWHDLNDDKIMVTNSGIYSLIRIFSDFLEYLDYKKIEGSKQVNNNYMSKIYILLDIITRFYDNISIEDMKDIRGRYGAGGKIYHWRTLQRKIKIEVADFDPIGLEEYWLNNDMRYNVEANRIIRNIELRLKKDVRNLLLEHYGNDWLKKGVPIELYKDLAVAVIEKNQHRESDNEAEPWDCLHLIDYRIIIQHSWNIFKDKYSKSDEKGKLSSKKDGTKWLERLNRIRNENFHSYSVTIDEINFLKDLESWIFSSVVKG